MARTNPEAMGTAIAVFNMGGMLSSIATVVVGWIRDITGSFVGGFTFGAVILLIGMVVVAFIDETVEEKKQPPPRQRPRWGIARS